MFGRYTFASLGVAALVGSAGALTVVHATTSGHSVLTCLQENAANLHLSDKQTDALNEGVEKGWSEDKTTAAMHMGAAKAKAEENFERHGCSDSDTSGGGGSDNGGSTGSNNGTGNTAGGSGGSSINTGPATNTGPGAASSGSASSGGTTGDNSPGSPSGSPGSTVTNCTSGADQQHGLVNVGLGNVCGIGILNGNLSNDLNGILTSSGGSTGGLLDTSGLGATGGLLSGLLNLGGLLGL